MNCQHCGAENSDQARFCQTCGKSLTPVSRTCAACGAVNTETAKFCVSCGQAMELPAAPAALPASIPPPVPPPPPVAAPPLAANPAAAPAGGHKIAALCIFVVAAILVLLGFASGVSSAELNDCIQRGGSGSTCHSTTCLSGLFFVLAFFTAALGARYWVKK